MSPVGVLRIFGIALAFAACVGERHRPMNPGLNTACLKPVYAGYPVHGLVYWSCAGHREGYQSAGPADCQREVVNIRPTCAGQACEVDVDQVGKPTWGIGQRETSLFARDAGRVSLAYEVTQFSGQQDTVSGTCELEPMPRLEIECVIRDRSTGGFVPCGVMIPPGAEVHITGVLGVASELRTKDFHFNIYRQAGRTRGFEDNVSTTCEDEGRDLTTIERCMWTSTPGAYRIELRSHNAIHEMRLAVSGER